MLFSSLLIISYVIPMIFGDWIDFSLGYFKGRRVTFVCLLTCRRDTWHPHDFVKSASILNVAVSCCDIDEKLPNISNDLDLCLKQTATSTGVLINSKCPYFEKIMDHASLNALFDSKHKWLIIEEKEAFKADTVNEIDDFEDTFYNDIQFVNENEVATISVLHNLNLSVDADITVSVKTDDSSYTLYEIYNFGKARNGKFVIESIGEWNLNKGLNISKEFKYYRRWDFQQMVFNMAVVMTPIPPVFDPQMILGMTPDQRVTTISHTSAMVLHEITGIHNFRYNYTILDRWVGDYVREHKAVTNALYFQEQDITPILRLLPDHFDRYDVISPPVTFIDQYRTKTETGFVKAQSDNLAKIDAFMMSAYFASNLNFTSAEIKGVKAERTRFYYRIPSQGVGKFENQFLRPLSSGSWWCVIGICSLCCIVLLLSALVENRPISMYRWCYSVFSVLALICQQFFEEFEDMRRISAARKLTILVTGLACLLLYNYYTSSVVSWLLNGPPPSINSLWELLDSPLEPMFEDVGYTYSWLQLPDYYFDNRRAKGEDVLKRRVKNMIKKGKTLVTPLNQGIELVRKGGYAYHADTNGANARISQTFNQQELCDLDSLHSMEKVLLYSCVQKNSPYREFFSWSLARLLERGIINCLHERTWTREVKCEGSSPRALALGGAAPAFIVLGAGCILATVIMLVERMWWKYSSQNKEYSIIIKNEDWRNRTFNY